jgi:shikimate 5-dehydrogenase
MNTAFLPTMYFIGVSTAQSSIMKIFPEWARVLGLGDAVLRGIDFPLHAEPAAYRQAVEFIKNDPLSLGALVTTHKIDLFNACRDLFDDIDPHAKRLGEASSISKNDSGLAAHAKDPISSGLAIESFLPENHWNKTGAEVFILGAGGAAVAISWYLLQKSPAGRPSRMTVCDRKPGHLTEIERLHRQFGYELPVEYVLSKEAGQNDRIISGLKPGSLVINATGMGKDLPGSPVTNRAIFPENGLAWELNYRGNLVFLDQARAQQSPGNLQIEDGWTYFIHGWTRVIAEVFHLEIPTHGPVFDELSEVAAAVGKPAKLTV